MEVQRGGGCLWNFLCAWLILSLVMILKCANSSGFFGLDRRLPWGNSPFFSSISAWTNLFCFSSPPLSPTPLSRPPSIPFVPGSALLHSSSLIRPRIASFLRFLILRPALPPLQVSVRSKGVFFSRDVFHVMKSFSRDFFRLQDLTIKTMLFMIHLL